MSVPVGEDVELTVPSGDDNRPAVDQDGPAVLGVATEEPPKDSGRLRYVYPALCV